MMFPLVFYSLKLSFIILQKKKDFENFCRIITIVD